MKKSIILIALILFSGFGICSGTSGQYLCRICISRTVLTISILPILMLKDELKMALDGVLDWNMPFPGNRAIELQYKRQDTNAPTTFRDPNIGGGGLNTSNFELGINWVMLNFTNYVPNEMIWQNLFLVQVWVWEFLMLKIPTMGIPTTGQNLLGISGEDQTFG
jgi:hypothetical protein